MRRQHCAMRDDGRARPRLALLSRAGQAPYYTEANENVDTLGPPAKTARESERNCTIVDKSVLYSVLRLRWWTSALQRSQPALRPQDNPITPRDGVEMQANVGPQLEWADKGHLSQHSWAGCVMASARRGGPPHPGSLSSLNQSAASPFSMPARLRQTWRSTTARPARPLWACS
jgi:hypothetical protein